MNRAATHSVLERFASGPHVLTVKHGDEEHGVTASWVSQASFDPPMVVVAVENRSTAIGMIRDTHHFALSVLHAGQRDVPEKLGRASAATAHKLKGIKTKPAPTSGVPVLADVLGWVECRVVATLPSGDHTLVLGEVLEAGVDEGNRDPALGA
jgi:flavin reductase (DIM6/NTAB) family NADH-FMN oxidoreductase RutF